MHVSSAAGGPVCLHVASLPFVKCTPHSSPYSLPSHPYTTAGNITLRRVVQQTAICSRRQWKRSSANEGAHRMVGGTQDGKGLQPHGRAAGCVPIPFSLQDHTVAGCHPPQPISQRHWTVPKAGAKLSKTQFNFLVLRKKIPLLESQEAGKVEPWGWAVLP